MVAQGSDSASAKELTTQGRFPDKKGAQRILSLFSVAPYYLGCNTACLIGAFDMTEPWTGTH